MNNQQSLLKLLERIRDYRTVLQIEERKYGHLGMMTSAKYIYKLELLNEIEQWVKDEL